MSEETEMLTLRNGKRVGSLNLIESPTSTHSGLPNTPTQTDKKRAVSPDRNDPAYILFLPNELLEKFFSRLQCARDMSAVEAVCTRLRAISTGEGGQSHWRSLYATHFGTITEVQIDAAALAGGFKALFTSRILAEREAAPWQRPSPFEVTAAVKRLAALPIDRPYTSSCIVFLVDGSGSVTEEDFACMTGFMLSARTLLSIAAPTAQLSVLQFSNDVRIETSPVYATDETFDVAVHNMHRMNGGTNISMAVQRAGQILKPLPRDTKRVLVLLTDGRVDSHQAREAHDMTARLGDEQGGVFVHAFGVGRGVDKHEMLRVISAQDPGSVEGRYLPLCVLDDAPW